MLCSNCNDERSVWTRNGAGMLHLEQCPYCDRSGYASGPLVSICIPTYNRPSYLRIAVLSCLSQTYRNTEIIITDNSDNDDTSKAVYAWNHPRISYYRNDGNIGSAASINGGISLAMGKYVKILMDDDVLAESAVALQVAALEANATAAVAMAPLDIINERGGRIFPKMYGCKKERLRYEYQKESGLVPRKQILKDFLTRTYPCAVPSGVLFRKVALDAVGPFSEDVGFAGDIDMFLRLAASWDFCYIDRVLASWRYVDDCHTKRLHDEGMDATVFYRLLHKTVADDRVKAMFGKDIRRLVMDGLLFCSMRAMLNFRAAFWNMDFRLFLKTVGIILWNDEPYNWVRLPFRALKQVFA
jgi:glycosyltransferase involved in cell wall biosynthesis